MKAATSPSATSNRSSSFLQETPPDKLLPKVVEKLKNGTDLKTFTAAAALANARAFGGEDYVGFHTLMALAPAYKMASEETQRRAQAARGHEGAGPQQHAAPGNGRQEGRSAEAGQAGQARGRTSPRGEQLRDAARKADMAAAEATFAAICENGKPDDALNALLVEVDDATEVHRVVLVSRAWDLINFVGAERAHTMLRQSVHYCVKIEQNANQAKYNQPMRETAAEAARPAQACRHEARHASRPTTRGSRSSANRVFAATADARRRGSSPRRWPKGSARKRSARRSRWPRTNSSSAIRVGRSSGPRRTSRSAAFTATRSASTARDTIHAWRNLARAGDRRTQVTSLILAGYQVARDRSQYRSDDGDMLKWEPYPRADASGEGEGRRGRCAHEGTRTRPFATRTRPRTAALTARIGAEKPDAAKDVFALLRGFAISEDGALHAEKYYATTSDEFAALARRVQVAATRRPRPRHRQRLRLPGPGRQGSVRVGEGLANPLCGSGVVRW